MAHNLYLANGQTSMFCATGKRGAPWHGLGQQVQDAQTWKEAMRLSGLDWTVSKHQLLSPIDSSKIDAYGIFRDTDSAFLGSVGGVYTPIQNEQCFDFVDTLLESCEGAHYESAGALGNGSRIWCLARVPYDITIAGTEDKSENYILFETSHDGTMSATAKLTSVRVVCQNTLELALAMKNADVKIRHSSSGTAKLETAKRMITGIQQSVETLGAKLNELARRKVTPTISKGVMDALFGNEWNDSPRKRNQVEEIAQLFSQNDHNAFPTIKGSAYNLLNAVTEYTDHYRDVRITEDKRGMSESLVRKESALFGGTGESMKARALDAILELTQDAPMMDTPLIIPTASSRVGNILSMVASPVLA
jgi:phage/plasmid-like protein (TIGR03299 family)